MRILVVNWNDRENPQAGGAEVHLHEIFGRLARRGHQVDLLASAWRDAPARASVDGLDIHRVGSRYTFQFHAPRYFYQHLKGRQYDVLVEALNKVPLYTMRWGARRVVGLVHHLFGWTIFREAPFPMAAAVWLAEQGLPLAYSAIPFQAMSEGSAADLVRRGIPAGNIEVIHTGIDTSFFTPSATMRSENPLFAYVGRLKKYKGVDIVLQAFSKVKHPGARLEVAGSGDHRATLERLCHTLGISDRVRFRGYISAEEKRDLLRKAWANVFTSPKEGWGLTNLEAQACGTPVIASDSPGLRESFIDGETGFLVPHGNISALTEKIEKIAGSIHTVTSMGQAGRRFAERFTWEKSADRTLSHLEQVVQRGN